VQALLAQTGVLGVVRAVRALGPDAVEFGLPGLALRAGADETSADSAALSGRSVTRSKAMVKLPSAAPVMQA
jgi:hypothetical protein